MHDDLALARALAEGAGRILLDGFAALDRVAVDFKGERNPVTDVDRASEAFLRGAVAEARPGDRFLGEEGGGAMAAERLWIVDPLDGTVNFMRGLPVFAVSIALSVNGVLEAGVVHAPALGETFEAARGGGARRNGRPVRVSGQADLARALLATGFAYDRSETGQNNLDNFGRLSLAALGTRRLGAAALDLAYVACGIFDGFWELHLAPWDVAAGALLVQEAGGTVTAFDGGGSWLFGGNIVASNGLIHEHMKGKLTPFEAA